MQWIKKGRIFSPDSTIAFSASHAALPSPFLIDESTIRIFYATRDHEQRSRITFIDVEEGNPSNIKYVHKDPIFSLGEPGTFDDRGATPSGLFLINGKRHFFYNGYNIGDLARYRIAVGVADMDISYKIANKYSNGPVQDRNFFDPCCVATPFVLNDPITGSYSIYYTSFTQWKKINGEMEPFYRIARAESEDGLYWQKKSICIDFDGSDVGGIVRPTIIHLNNIYHMWYSQRASSGYRDSLESSYRIMYASSKNGIDWKRQDSSHISPSDDPEAWDYEMVAYPYVIQTRSATYMFYNGNGFGKSGFGYAIAV